MVTPEDAERIALAQSSGAIMLVLRNPLDIVPTDTRGVRLASLMGGAGRSAGREGGERPGARRTETGGRGGRRRRLARFYSVEAIRGGQAQRRGCQVSASDRVQRRGRQAMKVWRRAVAFARCRRSSSLRGRRRRSGTPSPGCRPAAAPWPRRAQPRSLGPGEYPKVSLTAGRSTVLTTDFDITRIAITNPAIADATVVQPREILIDGKAPGTISLIVWGPDSRAQYDLVVEQPVTSLQQNLQMLFPGEDIKVSTSEDSTILSGQVSSTNIMLRAGEIAAVVGGQARRDQPAPGAWRQREPAGAAAGALRRGEPPRPAGARRQLLPRRSRDSAARITTQQFSTAEFDDAERRRPGVQRLPEPVLPRSPARHRRPGPGAGISAARFRAWPSRT